MIIIENENKDSDDDENSDNGDDDNDKLPADSPNKGSIMLSFDVTFVESENNRDSRVSGDLRHHVPHVTSL